MDTVFNRHLHAHCFNASIDFDDVRLGEKKKKSPCSDFPSSFLFASLERASAVRRLGDSARAHDWRRGGRLCSIAQ